MMQTLLPPGQNGPFLIQQTNARLARMSDSPAPSFSRNRLACYFLSGQTLRSRSVSDVVLSSMLDVPTLPARLLADWDRDIAQHLALEPGDVEALPLARARARWPDYAHCVQAVRDWTRTLGLPDVLDGCDAALMACRGARYHHDGAHYGAAVFCNLFLSQDRGLDLHFPATGHRIPLSPGTAVLFDTGQPHAVIARSSASFVEADFAPERERTQVFLSWELPVEAPEVGQALGITLDIDPATALGLQAEQLWRNGTPADVCPHSGRWTQAR